MLILIHKDICHKIVLLDKMTDKNPYDPVTQTEECARYEMHNGNIGLGDYAWVLQSQDEHPSSYISLTSIALDTISEIISHFSK